MGLNSIIQYYDGVKFTSNIPINISDKFISIKQYGIIGFNISKSNEYNSIIFFGKSYNYVINKITNCGLYVDLDSNQLKMMYLKLNEFIKNQNQNEDELTTIQEAYNNTYNLTTWIEELTDEYVPSPNEIKGLCELFKICYENNLQLYASY